MTEHDFKSLLMQRGDELWRDMPWRTDTRPYYVLVSELMLQQTQVQRVLPKFAAFIAKFPDEMSLSHAPLAEVLHAWQGLGYNRRAKYLHDAARQIVHEHDGQFPRQEADLLRLPGVGKNTAGAILAYAYNQPVLFIETNVRTVYIHHFFADTFQVSDAQIRDKLAATLDHNNPRRFYQALMDYGTWLKQNGVKNNARSKHYKKQAPLRGSVREMRGEIIRRQSAGDANWRVGIDNDARFAPALASLVRDGLVTAELANDD